MDTIFGSTEQTAALCSALVSAQSECVHVAKDSINASFAHKYASLAAVIAASNETLHRNGLAVITLPADCAGKMGMSVTIVHVAGGYLKQVFHVPVLADMHAFGSASTYARRYVLQAVLNMTFDSDDDGNAASLGNRVAAIAANAAVRAASGIPVPPQTQTQTRQAPPPATTVAAQRATNALLKRVERVNAAPPGSEQSLRDLVAKVDEPLLLRKAAESRLESLAANVEKDAPVFSATAETK